MAIVGKVSEASKKKAKQHEAIKKADRDRRSLKKQIERMKNRRKKSSSNNSQSHKRQTQETIDQLESGEMGTDENIYLVDDEIAISKKTAEAVAEYKRQKKQAQQEKQRKEFIQAVQEDTRRRHTDYMRKKKLKTKEEDKIKNIESITPKTITPETDITQKGYYTPSRKKSPQETMDVTTSIDLKQYMKLDNTVPKNIETKDTFRGVEQISKEALKQSKEGGFLASWGTYIDYKEQELIKESEFKASKSSKAVNEMIALSSSTQSITPTEYETKINTQLKTIDKNKLSIKEASNLLIVPAYFGVARGGKNVIHGLRHPVETVSSMVMLPFMLPEVVSHIAKKGASNPIGTVTELTTELYLWGKVSKGVHRVAKTKIIETPIKAKNIKILETLRKTKSGKVVKDVQVSVTTVKGKSTSRYFWQKPKTQPRKVINVDFQRKGTTIHKGGIKQTETLAHVKGVVKLKDGGKKLKFVPKESTLKGKPTTQYNLDSAYSGKTSAGTPLKGKTPKIKPEGGVHLTTKTRKAHTRELTTTKEIIKRNPKKGSPISDIKIKKGVNDHYRPLSREIQLKPSNDPFKSHTALHEAGHHIDINRGFGKQLKNNPKAMKEFNKITQDGGKFQPSRFEKRGYSRHNRVEIQQEMRADIVADFLQNPKQFNKLNPQIGKILGKITKPTKPKIVQRKIIKEIKVKESIKTKIQTKGTQTYSSKKINSGELVAEIQHTGNFVKRKYVKNSKIIKKKPKYDIEIDNKGNVKVLNSKKLQDFHYTESGKLIKTGKKPVSPPQKKILHKNKPTQSNKLVSIEKTSQSSISHLKSVSPVVKVVSKNAKVKGISVFSSPLENKQENKTITTGGLLEKPPKEKEKIKPVFDSYEKSDYDSSFKTKSIDSIKTNQIFDSINETDNKNKIDSVIGLKEDIISEQKFISINQQITDPIVEMEFKQKEIVVPVPLFASNNIRQSQTEEKGYNTYMYEDGKQVKANLSPLPKAEAERLGRDVADNSLSASYRVTETNINVPSSKRSKLATGGYVSPSKFTQSKSNKRRGFSIEKRNNRLDTFGEKKGIKASKLLANRKKSISNNIFGKSKKNNKRWF